MPTSDAEMLRERLAYATRRRMLAVPVDAEVLARAVQDAERLDWMEQSLGITRDEIDRQRMPHVGLAP